MTFLPSLTATRFAVSVVPTIEAAETTLRHLQRQGSSPLHWNIIAPEEVLNMISPRSRLAAMIADGSGIPVLPMKGLAAVGFIVNSIITKLFDASTQTDSQALQQVLQKYGLSAAEAAYHVEAVNQGHILLLIQVPVSFQAPRSVEQLVA